MPLFPPLRRFNVDLLINVASQKSLCSMLHIPLSLTLAQVSKINSKIKEGAINEVIHGV